MNIKNKHLSLPLIQGGMGVGISLGNLAGKVGKCGGMGVISTADIGFKEPDFWQNPLAANVRALKKEIKKAQDIACGNGLIAINAMVATVQYPQMIQAAIEADIDCIISGAGLPTKLPELAGDSNAAIAPVISSAKAAGTICKMWDRRYQRIPDFMVLEGSLAGGHLGFGEDALKNGTTEPLETLLPAVLKAIEVYAEKYNTEIPVFVAGGIDNAEEIEKFIQMGAAGVQIATKFIPTIECDAAEGYKQAFLTAKKEDIRIVKSPAGMPGRALWTPLMQNVEAQGRIAPKKCINCLVPCDTGKSPYCITEALIGAALGDYEKGLFFCGANAYKLDKITTVPEVLDELLPQWRNK
ncbi:MAG: nitronate monooxygenase family protein [Clostridiales bacterium]